MSNHSSISEIRQGNSTANSAVLLGEHTEKSEADIPVPDRLLPKGKSQFLVSRLKLSQKIGILLWLNSEGLLSEGGKERLVYLQAKASEEALIAGIRWSSRLTKERKLRADFQHQILELNRRPQSKRFRKHENSRIGVGYRDKGTLPDKSEAARRKSIEEAWVSLDEISVRSLGLILFSDLVQFVEDDWLDLGALASFLTEEGKRTEVIHLLSSL